MSFWREVVEELPKLPTGQVDSDCIHDIPGWQNLGMTAMVAANDLGATGLNFCYGMSEFAKGNLIVSAHRLDAEEMFGLTIHEAGHGLGLVRLDVEQHDDISAFEGHCKNECTMNAVNNKPEMSHVTARVARNLDVAGFCGQCANDLSKIKFE